MTKGQKILEKILGYFAEVRKQYPEITDDMLCNNGEVFYMNSKNGTYYDWQVNSRLSEFYLFYKDTELGFIKVIVTRKDTICGYAYLEQGNGKPIPLEMKRLKKGDANYLRKLLLQEADHKRLFDKSVSEIEFGNTIEREVL